MRKVNLKQAVVILALAVLTATLMVLCAGAQATSTRERADRAVHPLFDLSRPEGGPFPSDRFTVADPDQNTGRRVRLPVPSDCVANASDCADVTYLNMLDGFHLTPRLSIPFDGDIDVSTATGENIFIVALPERLEGHRYGTSCDASNCDSDDERDDDTEDEGGEQESGPGRVIGINQIVWDPSTHTLHATSDEALGEHSRHVLVVTRGVRDTTGRPITASPEFDRYRSELASSHDPELRWYRRELITAEWAARRHGVRRWDIAALSMFRTQSATYLVEKIRDQIRGGLTPATADFRIGPGGSRAIFPLNSIRTITSNRQTTVSGPLSNAAVSLAGLQFTPGAIGSVAFGRFSSPDFMVHPGEYIPEIPSLTGVPAQQGTNTIYFNVVLPAGPMPAGGWPVALYGHGTGRDKNQTLDAASVLASRGIAVIGFSMVGHGFGPRSTLSITRTDGTTAGVAANGRGIDQNGDGAIAAAEGDAAASPSLLQLNASAMVQNIADLFQLARVVQAGVDVDGDGTTDLDPGRMYYFGHSLGGMYGIGYHAYTPESRAAVFMAPGAPLFENRRLGPTSRNGVGAQLAARTPSLLNSANGLTSIGGVAVAAPFFNENLPLRNLPPVVNTVPGAIAIQQFVDRSEWIAQVGNPVAFAPRLRRSPPEGIAPRPVIIQFARGDTASPNPNTATILRAGELEDRATFFRHDLYFAANPTAPKNPHGYSLQYVAPFFPTIRGAQGQVADFFASDGANMIVPDPAGCFEVPVAGPLPEDFGYIP